MNEIAQGRAGNGKRNNQEAGMMVQKFNEGDTVRIKTNYFIGRWHGHIGIIDYCKLVGNEWRYIVKFSASTLDVDERYLTKRGVKKDLEVGIRYHIWGSFTD